MGLWCYTRTPACRPSHGYPTLLFELPYDLQEHVARIYLERIRAGIRRRWRTVERVLFTEGLTMRRFANRVVELRDDLHHVHLWVHVRRQSVSGVYDVRNRRDLSNRRTLQPEVYHRKWPGPSYDLHVVGYTRAPPIVRLYF